MRIAAALGLALMLAAPAAGSGPGTQLRIVVKASASAPGVVRTLRCRPARGTVPQPGRACVRLLAGGRALFAPTPKGTACNQIYGGPQTATVRGTLRGKPIFATFSRRDGCEVARWARVQFLIGLPAPDG
jgi:Subtilisin inhibitor-like